MYFGSNNDEDIKIFHNTVKSNFTGLLTDILQNSLFNVETIIENKLYRIMPLFYCDTITSTNPNDIIMENRCIICEYDLNTVLYFNTKNTVNDFDFNYEITSVNDNCFYDFIFYDNITLAKLNNVEIKVEYFDSNNNLLLSEDFISNNNGVFIYKFKNIGGFNHGLFTFKFNDFVKTLVMEGL